MKNRRYKFDYTIPIITECESGITFFVVSQITNNLGNVVREQCNTLVGLLITNNI